MSVWQLSKSNAHVSSVTNRAERHGPNLEPAMTIGMKVSAPADSCDALDKQLNKLMFRKPGKEESVQGELPGTTANEGNTARRFPKIGTFPWNEKFDGYAIEIGSGLVSTGTQLVDMVDVTIVSITPKDGGAVEYTIKASFRIDEDLAHLALLTGQDIEVSIRPRSEQQEQMAA
jgi:hypothetical protein